MYRLKRLMDLDDSFLTSLRPEGYDISCVQSGAHDQRIPKGRRFTHSDIQHTVHDPFEGLQVKTIFR